MSKVFGGMASSLDGFIQSTSGDLSWLNNAMGKDEDYGFAETMRRTGAYVVGANTYREMIKMGMFIGNAKTPCYVVTHDKKLKSNKHTYLYSGELKELVKKIKSEIREDKDICVYGGGDLVTQFIEQDLMDELSISIIPVVLGDGIPFFHKINGLKKLELFECKQYNSGIVILNYRLKHI